MERRMKLVAIALVAALVITLWVAAKAASAVIEQEPQTNMPGNVLLTSTKHLNEECLTAEPISENDYIEEVPERPYGEAEITMIAQVIWCEARGIKSDTEKAAVAWCVLNRFDAGYADTIAGVITAPNQFSYFPAAPAEDGLLALAGDVLERWWAERNGETDVGRVLPVDYYWFNGDGYHNYFRNLYTDGDVWAWLLASPYEEAE